MKQNKSVTAVEWLEEEINQQQKSYIDLAKKDKSLKKGVDAILTATTLLKMKCKKAKEIEKQQKGYSEEEAMEFFIEGYRQRAIASNLIFDNASRIYAIGLFKKYKDETYL